MSRADPLRVADYLQHILEAIDNIQDSRVRQLFGPNHPNYQ